MMTICLSALSALKSLSGRISCSVLEPRLKSFEEACERLKVAGRAGLKCFEEAYGNREEHVQKGKRGLDRPHQSYDGALSLSVRISLMMGVP